LDPPGTVDFARNDPVQIPPYGISLWSDPWIHLYGIVLMNDPGTPLFGIVLWNDPVTLPFSIVHVNDLGAHNHHGYFDSSCVHNRDDVVDRLCATDVSASVSENASHISGSGTHNSHDCHSRILGLDLSSDTNSLGSLG
jgi:hypothetical protein